MKASGYLTLSAIAVATAIIFAGPSQALTMKECSAKYKEAQKAGTLKGMKWNDFRKAECGASATPTSAEAPAAKTKEKKTKETKTKETKSLSGNISSDCIAFAA